MVPSPTKFEKWILLLAAIATILGVSFTFITFFSNGSNPSSYNQQQQQMNFVTQTVVPMAVSTTINPSSSSNENCIIGTWIRDDSPEQTWNYYSDGSFKDIHVFSNGRSQEYDWGTWESSGNNRYVMHLTSFTHNVVCNGDSLTMIADTSGPSVSFHRG